jgi:hypothetical protein
VPGGNRLLNTIVLRQQGKKELKAGAGDTILFYEEFYLCKKTLKNLRRLIPEVKLFAHFTGSPNEGEAALGRPSAKRSRAALAMEALRSWGAGDLV